MTEATLVLVLGIVTVVLSMIDLVQSKGRKLLAWAGVAACWKERESLFRTHWPGA